MKQEQFNEVVNQTLHSINNLLRVKGGEYAGSEDRLANFKRGATLTGATSLQVLFIYLSKHYDAVSTYVRDQANGTARERSEPIDGRLDDIINYCILAKALVKEIEARPKQVVYDPAKISHEEALKYLNDIESRGIVEQLKGAQNDSYL